MANTKKPARLNQNKETLENKQLESVILRVVQQHEFYQGPIPSPAVLGQYDEILPGAADRILTMAENNNEARIENEKALVVSKTANIRRGSWFSFFILLGLGSAGFYYDKGYYFWSCLGLYAFMYLAGSGEQVVSLAKEIASVFRRKSD